MDSIYLKPRSLNISLVLYQTPEDELMRILRTLVSCDSVHRIYLIDNSPEPLSRKPWEPEDGTTDAANSAYRCVEYRHNGKNLGYGAAHNIAIRESIYDNIPYHLALNTDIVLQPTTIENMLAVMESNPSVGLVQPRVTNPEGEMQYLCKLLPSPTDLMRRIILGKRGKDSRQNAHFELRHLDHTRPINAPYLSGCFMLFRVKALEKVGLFDERFFMYPEDIDITRRIHREYLTLYYPSDTIIHAHRQASYHSIRMLWIHASNMIRYFNKWGWIHDPERKLFNRLVLQNHPAL